MGVWRKRVETKQAIYIHLLGTLNALAVLLPDVCVTQETVPVMLAAPVLALAGGISDPHIKHEKPQNSSELALTSLIWTVAAIIRPGIGNGSSFVGPHSGKGIIDRY